MFLHLDTCYESVLFRNFLFLHTCILFLNMLCLHKLTNETNFFGGFMKNVRLHKILLAATFLSWLAFLFFLFLVYWNADYILELFFSLLIACIFTVMLSRFRSRNY